MRVATMTTACLWLVARVAGAEIAPETVVTATMAEPQPSWFMVFNSSSPAYIFDADDGQMQGLIALSQYTPAVQPNVSRGEFYAAESYYSRGVRGERTDILAIYDMSTLMPKAEVDIPNKFEPSFYRNHIGLLGNNRHVIVFNMTPAQSVSVVDIEKQMFVGEISTPGCSTIMPVDADGFLMICGDGTLQLIRVDESGEEAERVRSREFFSVADDPIGDNPVASSAGWLFQSFNGMIYEASVDGDRVRIGKPWSLLDDIDSEEGWRIGSSQPMAYNAAHDLLFTLMHVGDIDARDDPATEVWVFKRQQQRRLFRMQTDSPVKSVMVSQEAEPRLLLLGLDATVSIYDGLQLKKLGTIEEVGPSPSALQGF